MKLRSASSNKRDLHKISFLLLGVIQASNSSIIIKDDDGNDIKLTLLKNPINLNTLTWENGYNKQDVKVKTKKKFRPSNEMRKPEMALLKEPISLEDWNKEEVKDEITYNVKTVQGSYSCGRARKKVKDREFQLWKLQALTLFEHSFVYPFVHAGNKYKCFVCAKPFLEAKLLKEHSTNDHSVKDLKRELSNRIRDKNLKIDITHLQCKICHEKSTDFNSLKMHIKGHGKDLDLTLKDNLIPFKLGGNTFECQVCGESYLKLRLLIIHMSKHFNNYSCEVCGSMFISLNLLKRHQQTHISGNFPCDKCDKVFNNSAKRTLHMRGVHLKQLLRRCPMCPERFNSNYQRSKHLRVVHNQTSGLYKCETCGREYDLKYHLLIHVRSVHLQERNQECSVCHSRFFSKHSLSRHMVIHTGEKIFKCNVCGKAFARRKTLREHFRLHEMANNCSICGHNCVDQASFVSHMSVAHGVV